MSEVLDQVLALVEQLSNKEMVQVVHAIGVCPFDCDSCHDEDCICERLGCAGYEDESEEP